MKCDAVKREICLAACCKMKDMCSKWLANTQICVKRGLAFSSMGLSSQSQESEYVGTATGATGTSQYMTLSVFSLFLFVTVSNTGYNGYTGILQGSLHAQKTQRPQMDSIILSE